MELGSHPPRTGPYRVLALSGSLRKVSANATLLEAAARLLPAEVEVATWQGLADLPHFNPDDDTAPLPVQVVRWRAAIARADALLLSSPEYAHGVPGSLKNALDWLVSGAEFPALLVALLSPSPYSNHVTPALAETLRTMSGHVVEEASVVVPLAGRRLGVEEILADPELAGPLGRGMQALVQALRHARRENRRLVGPA